MNDTATVQGCKRGKDVEGDRHTLRDAHRPSLQAPVERLAFEQLHRNEQVIALVIADVVDLADIRMVDAGRRARLAPESLARSLVVGP